MSLVSDTHSQVIERLEVIHPALYIPHETALIILGDTGINFWLNKNTCDKYLKEQISKTGYTIYAIRGNHEERPENISSYQLVYDDSVKGKVWQESKYPNIKFFVDGGIYNISNHSILTIGGAYSIDKEFRIIMDFPYFKDELLTADEMQSIEEKIKGKYFDFVLTHTCPTSIEPKHLFLSGYNQNTIDKSMEEWLDRLKNQITYKKWLFGHFHSDEIINKNYYLLHKSIIDLFNF